MARDKLVLRNMVLYGYHGPFAAEEELGQRYEVDLELSLDLSQSSSTDDVELSLNTVDLFTVVKEIVEEQEFHLPEALAEAISSQILDSFNVDEVVVRVRKPNPPLGGLVGNLEVELVRTKN
jgi:dihydroneopterin aldolase